jgi:hypothetical protein
MDCLKILLGSILELESQKVPVVWKRSTTELDGKGASVIGCIRVRIGELCKYNSWRDSRKPSISG